MKKLLIVLSTFVSVSAFASSGIIKVTPATNRENTLDLVILGDAATAISKQLTDNGKVFKRDRFSGAMVQLGTGVRCIDQHAHKPLYCYIAITGSSVN